MISVSLLHLFDFVSPELFQATPGLSMTTLQLRRTSPEFSLELVSSLIAK